jgi:hypothetical protein
VTTIADILVAILLVITTYLIIATARAYWFNATSIMCRWRSWPDMTVWVGVGLNWPADLSNAIARSQRIKDTITNVALVVGTLALFVSVAGLVTFLAWSVGAFEDPNTPAEIVWTGEAVEDPTPVAGMPDFGRVTVRQKSGSHEESRDAYIAMTEGVEKGGRVEILESRGPVVPRLKMARKITPERK